MQLWRICYFYAYATAPYKKIYICCKKCEKKKRKDDNIKKFTPNTTIVKHSDYLSIYCDDIEMNCDIEHYEILKDTSFTLGKNANGDVDRIQIYSPKNSLINVPITTVLFGSKDGLYPIYKDFNFLNLRSNNVLYVDIKTFTKFHHLYNNRNSKTYLIETRKNKNGINIYKPSLKIYKEMNLRIKSSDLLENAILLRNELLNKKYEDNEAIQIVLSHFYCN